MTQSEYAACDHRWETLIERADSRGVEDIYACLECWAYRIRLPLAGVAFGHIREVEIAWPDGNIKVEERDILPDNEPEMNGSAPVSEP